VKIGNRTIGPDNPPFVIAEIGINHEGDIEKAKQMVMDAHKAGAECVKFQCHIIEDEMVPEAQNIIPANADESIYEIMERCALSKKDTLSLKKLVEDLGMIYMSTPFSRAAANQLEEMGVVAYKIGSGECNNYPLIEHIASFGKPVILSTGMNDISTITPAVKILEENDIPYALLHCTSMYPTPYNKVRLEAIIELKKEFPNSVVGLSDHSLGNYTCFGATALGASILEKHFTSSKEWEGPDIFISIDPLELSDLIKGSEAIHSARHGSKSILSEEQPTIDFAYASVVAINNISPGEILSYDNIWVKRPGTGQILAKDFKSLLGRVSQSFIVKDSQLTWEDLRDE
tara:strand:+ start:8477 stop:9511 length:1035 start_codon:yes stop_codon:yes gene_type:complete